jgi:GDP-4-dehydro-6-deoxy-D-mannose reductase
MRVLITGAGGFAGGHLAAACAAAGDDVTGVARTPADPPWGADVEMVALDLRDTATVRATVREAAPEAVYHLAALSSVARSWEDPGESLEQNVQTTLSILEAVRAEAPQARLLLAGSCEVYGRPAELPIPEDAPPNPQNPYAVSKLAADLLGGVYAEAYGLDVIRARPFSHSGPGQQPIYLMASLARQAALGRRSGERSLRIATGNPETRRDFTDVRDITRAYRLLVTSAPAGVYNVASGRSVSAGDLIERLRELLAPIEVEHLVDPALVRPHEVMDLRGASERLTAATGWQPEIALEQTLADTVADWLRRLDRAPE